MKVMILAAGRGERMRPLTDDTPKPLLLAAGKPLIVHTIEQLVAAGLTEIVINHAYLGEQIETALGNGAKFGAHIIYSPEKGAGLETAGGIINALPLLSEQFLVVNGDIATNFPFANLKNITFDLAHLILVNNPEHHLNGDFVLCDNGLILNNGDKKLTFSGISLYKKSFFENTLLNSCKLAPLLREMANKKRISGEKFNGFWFDIGTPQRLCELDNFYTKNLKIIGCSKGTLTSF